SPILIFMRGSIRSIRPWRGLIPQPAISLLKRVMTMTTEKLNETDTTASESAPAPQPAVQPVQIMGRDEVTELRTWEKEQAGDGAPRFSVDELAKMERDSGSEEDKIREATREHRRKHPREDDQTIEWRVKGDGPLTLDEATHAKFASRQLHVGNAHGLSPEDSLRD